MPDSTLYLDADGIRRDRPILPKRHSFTDESLLFLSILADLGEPESVNRQGWLNLLRVHGFLAVVQATARCYARVGGQRKVSNDQAQMVLDGFLPSGEPPRHHKPYRRRAAAA